MGFDFKLSLVFDIDSLLKFVLGDKTDNYENV